MRVIVTRPRVQAAEWVDDLRRCGIDAAALPLIEIVGAPDPQAIASAWTTLEARRLVVFVSPSAAAAFFVGAPAAATWPRDVRAASPGPGTTAALLRFGVPSASIVTPAADAPQFDSESLWAALAHDDWHDASVLVVRGTRGRDWLAARLRERGATLDELAAYGRAAAAFGPAERRLLSDALVEPRRHLWLFSSAESIERLDALEIDAAAATASTPPTAALQSDRARRWARARAIATHPRIAARARALGFAEVTECRPTLAALVGCIQSLRP